ncbi:lysylphosphatidylglycerol synthase domain-containing protein [Luteimonas sp. RD2P54]|uniref:Lysylphosphatidylglycerol synthase domain-containing protein n=1 Tax=Luteimonas endophytica TaxID=3042023 RepID=A0ABT6JDR3_9GAMM|nr:lysylphosphatidylglycerol synthase domain-containing protein [Luteimonas endophytica]MDH5824348.1 lysylphosphatidylglycerol synthase domain-containing protein [Luteimonas endophytica]
MSRTDAAGAWSRVRGGLGRGFALLLLAAVAFALIRYAGAVDWREVGTAVAGYPPSRLAAAAGLAVASYLLYGAYDLAARRYAGHDLSTGRVLRAALISYAFNLNLGALIGGIGFRVRMYLRAGVDGAVIARVVAFSIVSNWLGYAALAGALLAFQPGALAEAAGVPAAWLRAAGAAALALVAGYLAACAGARQRVLRLRGHAYRLPSLPLALAQLGLSSLNWLAISAIVFVLLGAEVAYPVVLGTLLAGAVFAALVHVPAGLGALEATFLALLGARIGQEQLIAALLVYRAIYYLAPLLFAVVAYLGIEAGGLRLARGRQGGGRAPPVGRAGNGL